MPSAPLIGRRMSLFVCAGLCLILQDRAGPEVFLVYRGSAGFYLILLVLSHNRVG